MSDIQKFLCSNSQDYLYVKNCVLSTKTWIHRGGIVEYYVEPLTTEALITICRLCYSTHLHFMVVGHTSNLYFLQDDCPNIIISTRKLTFWKEEPDSIRCQPGVMVKKLAAYCNENGISGFEGFVDLPGTIAGATVNNSSCFGSAMSSLLQTCTVLKEDGSIVELNNEDLQYTRRNSVLKQKLLKAIVIEVTLKAERGSADELLAKAQANHQKRLDTQEGPAHNLGSTYAEMKKTRIAGFITRRIDQFGAIFKVKSPLRFRKSCLLVLYGYYDLDPYISDKNLNCFIWRDEKADEKFIRYKKFINKISTSNRLEIEIIGKYQKK